MGEVRKEGTMGERMKGRWRGERRGEKIRGKEG